MPSRKPTERRPSPRSSKRSSVSERGRRVLAIEAEALRAAGERLDASFDRCVKLFAGCRGKIVVTGMGKSGHVARKIAATLTSTGSPAVFLHAAEASHGDAGMFVRGDVVLAISHSGETDELVCLLPIVKRLRLPLVVLTGRTGSTLGRAADVVLDGSVSEEACPLGLAPTASTTVALALGDAVAVALLQEKGFDAGDFAALHPAGALGRKLLKVADVMHAGKEMPVVPLEARFQETLMRITEKRLGVTGVVAADGTLAGVITDGDVRRALERRADIRSARARDLMTTGPKTIDGSALAEQAVAEMERHSITSLFVLDRSRKPVGVVHLHDLLKSGVV